MPFSLAQKVKFLAMTIFMNEIFTNSRYKNGTQVLDHIMSGILDDRDDRPNV